MAGITLFQIPGLNREDTPVFDSITRQNTWFDSQTKTTVTDGFYPPHFRNKITLELDMVIDPPGVYPSYEIKYNYVRILFNGKAYYYFIDHIEYVNEDLVDFYITLDTIQTYMFDINWIQSHITRKSIKRWIYDEDSGNYLINRDYLRENFSSGKFILKEKKYYTYNADFSSNESDTSPITGYVYVKFPSDGDALESVCVLPDGVHWLFSYSSCRILFAPEIHGTLQSAIEWQTFTPSVSVKASNALNKAISSHTDVIFASYLPFDNVDLASSYIDPQTDVFVIPATTTLLNDHYVPKYPDGSEIRSKILYDDYELPFYRNTNYSADFDYKMVPQLIDESYLQISWGEPTARSQFPLHALTLGVLRLNYFGDVFTCKRSYYITAEYTNVTPQIHDSGSLSDGLVGDTFNTMVIANNLITVDVNTDAFKQYYTYNAASSVMSGVSAALALAMLL